MPIISKKPLIEILSPEEQHDRFDINYYLPEFIDAERYLENCDVKFTTLGDVMADDAGYGVLPSSSSYIEEGGVYLVRSSNVSSGGVEYESAVRVPSEWVNSERARIKRNDVLVSIKGARAFFDMCVVIDGPPEAIVNGSIFRFQCKEGFSPLFIVFWLLSKPIQDIVFRERANLGISYISQDVIKNIPVPEFNLREQLDAVKMFGVAAGVVEGFASYLLGKYQSAVTLLQSEIDCELEASLGLRNPQISSVKYKVVKPAALEDRLDWKTYDPALISDPQKLSGDFKGSKPLHELAILVDDYVRPEDIGEENLKLIRVKWHGKGAELREVKRAVDISGDVCRVEEGDVVVSRIDSTQGAIAVVPASLSGGVISKEFYCIRVHSYPARLLVKVMLHERYRAFFMSAKTGGTKRLRLDWDTIHDLPIPIGNLSGEENGVVEKIISYETRRDCLDKIKSKYDERCDSFMEEVRSNPAGLTNEIVSKVSAQILSAKIESEKEMLEALQ